MLGLLTLFLCAIGTLWLGNLPGEITQTERRGGRTTLVGLPGSVVLTFLGVALILYASWLLIAGLHDRPHLVLVSRCYPFDQFAAALRQEWLDNWKKESFGAAKAPDCLDAGPVVDRAIRLAESQKPGGDLDRVQLRDCVLQSVRERSPLAVSQLTAELFPARQTRLTSADVRVIEIAVLKAISVSRGAKQIDALAFSDSSASREQWKLGEEYLRSTCDGSVRITVTPVRAPFVLGGVLDWENEVGGSWGIRTYGYRAKSSGMDTVKLGLVSRTNTLQKVETLAPSRNDEILVFTPFQGSLDKGPYKIVQYSDDGRPLASFDVPPRGNGEKITVGISFKSNSLSRWRTTLKAIINDARFRDLQEAMRENGISLEYVNASTNESVCIDDQQLPGLVLVYKPTVFSKKSQWWTGFSERSGIFRCLGAGANGSGSLSLNGLLFTSIEAQEDKVVETTFPYVERILDDIRNGYATGMPVHRSNMIGMFRSEYNEQIRFFATNFAAHSLLLQESGREPNGFDDDQFRASWKALLDCCIDATSPQLSLKTDDVARQTMLLSKTELSELEYLSTLPPAVIATVGFVLVGVSQIVSRRSFITRS